MSITLIKKHAKNLKKTLPAFVAEHGTGPYTADQIQDLAAQINGYPNWHTANKCIKKPSANQSHFDLASIELMRDGSSGIANFEYPFQDDETAHEAYYKLVQRNNSYRLSPGRADESKAILAEAMRYSSKYSSSLYFIQLKLWLEYTYLGWEHAIDGYGEVISYLDDLIAINKAEMIDYHWVHNRPYFTLNQGYIEVLGEAQRYSEAKWHCRKMLVLWPSDHFGFRQILQSLMDLERKSLAQG
ncbi:hypothetical protein ACI2KR_08960 [Pseudomonas luteola]